MHAESISRKIVLNSIITTPLKMEEVFLVKKYSNEDSVSQSKKLTRDRCYKHFWKSSLGV